MKLLLVASSMLCLAWSLPVQFGYIEASEAPITQTETVHMESSFSRLNDQSTLLLRNINGSIRIEGYNGKTVKVEIKKTVEANSQALIRTAFRDLQVAENLRGDTLELVLDFPWEKAPESKGKEYWNQGYFRNGWKWNPEYDFRLDFTILVPRQIDLCVSTINNGQIMIEKVEGDLRVNHVNGGIDIQDIRGKTDIRTINGNVSLSYAAVPKQDSHFFSHNGEIRLTCPKGLSAKMYFKSYNGEFYTNLEQLRVVPEEVKQRNYDGEEGIRYVLDSRTAMVSRGGAVTLDFETFNGNVYVEETN